MPAECWLCLFPILVALIAWSVRVSARRSTSWPTVEGVVTGGRIVRQGEGGAGGLPTVRYTYQVNGTNYEADRIAMDGFLMSAWNAEEIVSRYPVGAVVRVYHHPKKISFSLLEPGARGGTLFLLAVAGVLEVLTLLLCFRPIG